MSAFSILTSLHPKHNYLAPEKYSVMLSLQILHEQDLSEHNPILTT
jgi:hypothetical protein